MLHKDTEAPGFLGLVPICRIGKLRPSEVALPSPIPQRRSGSLGPEAEQDPSTTPDSTLPRRELQGGKVHSLEVFEPQSYSKFAEEVRLKERNHPSLGAQTRALGPPGGQMRVDCATRLEGTPHDPGVAPERPCALSHLAMGLIDRCSLGAGCVFWSDSSGSATRPPDTSPLPAPLRPPLGWVSGEDPLPCPRKGN